MVGPDPAAGTAEYRMDPTLYRACFGFHFSPLAGRGRRADARLRASSTRYTEPGEGAFPRGRVLKIAETSLTPNSLTARGARERRRRAICGRHRASLD